MNVDDLLELIRKNSTHGLIGYTELELEQIERLYDISLDGDFRFFLKHAGRSSGCDLNCDTEFIFDLHCTKDVRKQVIKSHGFIENLLSIAFKEMKNENQHDLKKHRFSKYIFGKPFPISIENQTQEYFILTTENNGNKLYRFDTNEDKIYDTGETIIKYLSKRIVWNRREANTRRWVGELLVP